jgi:hypothetical protein
MPVSWKGRVLTGVLILVGLGSAWWLFGFSTYRMGESRTTLYRRFGRVTRIDSNVVANGKTIHERLVFSWSKPFVSGDPITDCAAIFPESWQDRNGDGRWDTWIYRVGPDSTGHCKVEYRVDTKGLGRPDWIFTLPYGQYKKADAMMQERRGF